jgi:hypothetical protein
MNLAQISVTNSTGGEDISAELDNFVSVIVLENAVLGRRSSL